jgi:NADPH:quinone reductase
MKTYVVDAANGPFREVVVVKPEPGPGQVLVRIRVSGVNPLDTKIRAGRRDTRGSRFQRF